MIFDLKTKERFHPVSALGERASVVAAGPVESAGPPRRRMLWAGPVVALVSMVAALITTDAAGLPLRDPDHVAGRRLLLVALLVLILVGIDVYVRASRRIGGWRPGFDAMRAVRQERWTTRRGIAVGVALASFYIS